MVLGRRTLTNNQITEILAGQFGNLPSLTSLFAIVHWLLYLSSLHVIARNLGSNAISFIGPGAFASHTRLALL